MVRTKRSAISVRFRRPDRGLDDGDAFAAEDFVEGAAELAVAVADQEPCLFEQAAEVRLRACWVTQAPVGFVGAAGEVDAAAVELDEEEDVVAAEAERLDGEEVAGEDARCLLADELAPARSDPPRRRLESRGEQDPPDAAGRDAVTELEQFSSDPLIAPAWVLACQPKNKLPDV